MSLFTKKAPNTPDPSVRGFSLIELLITIAIVTLITAIVMVRYSSFDSSILLNNQAYEIALDLREAQVRSVSIQAGNPSGDIFSSGYGLFFDTNNPNEYILFQDAKTGAGPWVNNDRYDVDGSGNPLDILVDTLRIDPRFRIGAIRYDSSPAPSTASIVFRRPNYDAIIKSIGITGVAEQLEIDIVSVRNPTAVRTVVITSSGQISVK